MAALQLFGLESSMDKFENKKLDKLLKAAERLGLTRLSFSDGVKTNWVVFTGTYSSGKTTLVQDLADFLGVCFRQEPARPFIERQIQSGRPNADIWADVGSTVVPVHKLRVDSEYSLDIRELVLLDTAIPDTLPYALLYGIDPKEIIKASGFFRYKEPIFLLEPLPFKSNGVRNLNLRERMALHYLREKIYIILGYRVINVPMLGKIERRDFVLRYLREMLEVRK